MRDVSDWSGPLLAWPSHTNASNWSLSLSNLTLVVLHGTQLDPDDSGKSGMGTWMEIGDRGPGFRHFRALGLSTQLPCGPISNPASAGAIKGGRKTHVRVTRLGCEYSIRPRVDHDDVLRLSRPGDHHMMVHTGRGNRGRGTVPAVPDKSGTRTRTGTGSRARGSVPDSGQ
jgi:hypothetical protein